jgi:hypothetical protein
MGDILVKEGHLFSIVFISKLLGYIVLEEYLIKEKNYKNRQLIAKFRTSDHCLQIETGRYINIPHQQRLCTTCNILEDEYHFLVHLNHPRNIPAKFGSNWPSGFGEEA